MKRTTSFFLLLLGLTLVLVLAYLNSSYRTKTRVFSQYSVLDSSWEKYKTDFINQDGRIIDTSQNDMTTSEGQSYALLRAVWQDDKETFDRVWNWTKNNLKRPNDNLFGWNWGKKEDGSYGFLNNGGQNSASDADSDIALALLFASKKWNDPQYASTAQSILNDIWKYETEEVKGKRYLIAGGWATSQSEIVMNPSYFAPYAWRIFNEFDSSHNWNSLVDPAYDVLNKSGQITLHGKKGVGLPPNWIALDKATGDLKQPNQDNLSSQYSFDAMRIPWRISLDEKWFHEPKAHTYLQSLSALAHIFNETGILTGAYEHDGIPLATYESPAMYATSLAYFKTIVPSLAEKIYNEKLVVLYSNDTNTLKKDLNYYDQNWVWFSLAFYYDKLPNLYTVNLGGKS